MTSHTPEPSPAAFPSEVCWPEAYADEVMPDPRAEPNAWIVRADDGTPHLHDEQAAAGLGRRLTEGDLVSFFWRIDHGEATLTLREDRGFTVDPPMPCDAESVCVLDGLQCDTMADCVDDCVALLRDVDEFDDGDTFRLAYYTWTSPVQFRFDAARGRFVAAGAVQ